MNASTFLSPEKPDGANRRPSRRYCARSPLAANRALIADPGGGYLSRFGEDDSLILNPFDDGDAGWSPFAEIEWTYDCQRLAKATIPDVEGEAQQWHFYAQTLFAEVLRALWEQRRHSIAQLLRLVMSAETEELGRTLDGTAAAILTARGNERMLANTRVICSTYLNAWRYLPEGGSFSVREWVRQTARKEHTWWLYPVYRDDQMAMLRLLVTTWLDLALVETLSLPEQPCAVCGWFSTNGTVSEKWIRCAAG
jgi:hypothetical protein